MPKWRRRKLTNDILLAIFSLLIIAIMIVVMVGICSLLLLAFTSWEA